jgi:hypothetical protein
MQHAKSVFVAATAMAFALCALLSPAGEPDEKRPPITLKVGEETVVDLKGVWEAVAVLEPSERTEFLRDVLMTTAFSAFPSSQECRHDFLAVYGALRRPHLDPLAPGEVGRGRYAALSKDAGLLLVPFDDTGKSFDPTTAYRLLDKQMCLEGKLPTDLHVVAYRLDGARGDLPKASLTRLDTIQSKLFYTDGKHGYVEAEIGEAADLGKLLEKVDDLLAVRVKGKKLVVAGRKYPDETYKAKVRDRITLDDLKVLWAAFHDTKAAEAKMAAKIKERFKDKKLSDELLAKLVERQLEVVGQKGSELGFSLDPWIDLKMLQQLLAQVLSDKDLRQEVSAVHIKSLEECKKRVDDVLKGHGEEPDADKRHPVMEIPSTKADDRTGLFVFKDEVSRELQKSPNDPKLKRIVALLEVITHKAQFIRARYEGVLPGTPVAMTMYYCDLIAKAYAFGQVEVKPLLGAPRIEPIAGLPRIEGFQPWPQIKLGGQYWDEIRKAKSLRLWWSVDTNGFRWDKKNDETQIVFGPQAVRISFRNKVGEIAEEEDPDPLRALFRDRWNRHYLDIADQDCVFHHFNQIYKWAIAIKSLKVLGQSDRLTLLAGKPARTDLRFDKWYQDAVSKKKVGFQVKFDFSKRYEGVAEETMGFVHSGKYTEAGRERSWIGGGDEGPTAIDIALARRSDSAIRKPGNLVTLPTGKTILLPYEGRERVIIVPGQPKREITVRQGGRDQKIVIPEVPAKLESPSVRLLLPRARLESELMVRPEDATLRNWVNDGTAAIDSSRLTTKMIDGRVVVEWTSGTYDRAFSITRAISAGRDLDSRQVAEVRYSETGDRMLLRLAGEKDAKPIWLEVLPGGFGGGKKPPTGAVAIGSPGEPGWFYTIVRPEVTDDELARYRPSNGKGFIRVELTGLDLSPYRLGADWFPKPSGLLNSVSLFGKGVTGEEVKTVLLNASAQENRCVLLLFETIADPANSKRLADVARSVLQKDAQDEAFDLVARAIGRGATPLEIRIGSGKDRLTVTRQGDNYVVSRGAVSDSLLPAESPFRYVVTEPETPTLRGVRVVDQMLIVPENPTDAHRKTAREVVEFLTKNPDLIPVASNVSDLSTESLTKLKTGYEALGKSATLEWNEKAKTFTVKGTEIKFTVVELRAYESGRPLPEGVLEGLKKQPLVLEGAPAEWFNMRENVTGKALRKLQAEGVQIVFKLSDTPAGAMPDRLRGLMAWHQLDFEAESVALHQVTEEQVKRFAIGYLRSKALPQLLARENEGGQVVRVIVDHAEGKLTVRELIDRANRGEYRGRHVILAVCNDSPADIVAFCKAAYKNGCRGVVIPSAKISIPIALLTAESLNRDPRFRSGSIPQAAWKKAERFVMEQLDAVIKEASGDDAAALRLIDEKFPVQPGARKMSDMFRDQDGKPKGAIDQINKFKKDAEPNTWNQTTSRPLSPAESTRVAA